MEAFDTVGRYDEFELVYHVGFNSLLACRQVYTEATSILYKSNTFAFLSQWRKNGIRDSSDWLEKLGSQIHLLRDLHIELPLRDESWGFIGVPPPVGFASGSKYANIGRLVDLFRGYDLSRLNIRFTNTAGSERKSDVLTTLPWLT